MPLRAPPFGLDVNIPISLSKNCHLGAIPSCTQTDFTFSLKQLTKCFNKFLEGRLRNDWNWKNRCCHLWRIFTREQMATGYYRTRKALFILKTPNISLVIISEHSTALGHSAKRRKCSSMRLVQKILSVVVWFWLIVFTNNITTQLSIALFGFSTYGHLLEVISQMLVCRSTLHQS